MFSELLVARLLAAKKRLEVERAAEVLHKASVTYKSVADLPKLETAVLNARKVRRCGRRQGLLGSMSWLLLHCCSPRRDRRVACSTRDTPLSAAHIPHLLFCLLSAATHPIFTHYTL